MQYSIVNYKTVKENSDFRIDADYYHPVYLKEDTQKEIKELIENSFNDRKLSKPLLEIAKRGVEMAIEKDEQEAKNGLTTPLKNYRRRCI